MISLWTNHYQIGEIGAVLWTLYITLLILLMASCWLITKRFSINKESMAISRFILVIITNIISFICVILLSLPIQSKNTLPQFDVLITGHADVFWRYQNSPQFEKNLVDSQVIWLQEATYENLSNDDKTLLLAQYADKVQLINSTEEISSRYDNNAARTAILKVYGDGVTDAQWQHLSFYSIELFPSNKQLGLINLVWNKEVLVGETLKISGVLQKPFASHRYLNEKDETYSSLPVENAEYELALFEYKHIVDKVVLQAGDSFELEVNNKMAGRFTYRLTLSKSTSDDEPAISSENKTIAAEMIAVNVSEVKPPKILIKQSSPSFETRQIVRWANQFSSEISIITQVSQDKWQYKELNKSLSTTQDKKSSSLTKRLSHELTTQSLKSIDIAFFDTRALLALSVEEVEALLLAVSKGLGVHVFADNKLLSPIKNTQLTALLSKFSITAATNEHKRVAVTWPAMQNYDEYQSQLPVRLNLHSKHTQILVSGHNDKSLVSSINIGLGKFAISAIAHTYQWTLQAKQTYYSQYWQYLFTQLARNEKSTRWLSPSSVDVSMVNEPKNLCLISTQKQLSSSKVLLNRYPLTNEKWCGRFLTDKSGWQRFTAIDENQHEIAEQIRYFYSPNSFNVWQQANLQKISHQYATPFKGVENKIETPLENGHRMRYGKADKSLLWGIFIFSLFILWLERKLYMN